MKYLIHPRCEANIYDFYNNVAKKYSHTYSSELMHKNATEAVAAIYKIENGLLRRQPTIDEWKGYFMANTRKWYYAYVIVEDMIIVVDARHAQNMN